MPHGGPKYHGPCTTHTTFALGCGHCSSWTQQKQRSKALRAPAGHDVEIYRALHWPAPVAR